jgi:hypothetical protein
MSALDVLQSVLNEIGIFKNSPELSNNTDADVVEIRNFMNLAGQEIARRADFAKLFVTVTTGGNINSYILPDSFFRLPNKGGTVRLNKTNQYIPVIQVVNDAMWTLIKARPSANIENIFFYQTLNRIDFSIDLDVDGVILTYISKLWVNDNVNGRDNIQNNGDNILIPEALLQKGTVWRWMRKKGLPYEDHFAEFEADLKTELDANRGFI